MWVSANLLCAKRPCGAEYVLVCRAQRGAYGSPGLVPGDEGGLGDLSPEGERGDLSGEGDLGDLLGEGERGDLSPEGDREVPGLPVMHKACLEHICNGAWQ